ncbi:YesL family protein [Mediterraneibacter sp.]|jgi:uncharacterized membrane protein YesL|uniref:YesL family protein n=1 Tax=Mediterraneibacter sp. TaxID=2316022 RepID=UPI0015B1D05B|nr:DUF624 domain-containing protein [Mediterraneibacter sp.]
MRGDVTDSGIMRVLSKVCDIVSLNVLWLVCSLPIITIGASTTALYTVMLKLVKNEEGYIFKGFLNAFKSEFKKSTIIWLILLLFGGVCFIDYRVSGMMPGTMGMAFKSIFLLLSFFLVSMAIYSFALTARYENTVKATLKNALLLTVAKLPYTLLMTALTVGAVVLSWWNTGIMMLVIPVWILIGTGLLAFVNSHILRRVFRVFDEKSEDDAEEGTASGGKGDN